MKKLIIITSLLLTACGENPEVPDNRDRLVRIGPWAEEVLKFCDHGRAVYQTSSALFVVPNAEECK